MSKNQTDNEIPRDEGFLESRRTMLQHLGSLVLGATAVGGVSMNVQAASNAAPAMIRRIVTANNAAGKSYFLKDEVVPFGQLWTNGPDEILGPGPVGELKTILSTSIPRLDPPHGGAMMQFLEMPPTTKKRGEAVEKVLATNGGPNKDGWHRTMTIDYIFFVNGEVDLILDEGQTTVRGGDIVIQRNTSHAWQNYGNEPTKLFVVNLRV